MNNLFRTTFFLLVAIAVLTGCRDNASSPQPTVGSADCKPVRYTVTRLRDNKLVGSYNFAYDQSGNLTFINAIDSVGNSQRYATLTYRGNNLVTMFSVYPNTQVQRHDGTYNAQNQLIRLIHKDSSSQGVTLDTVNIDYSVTGRIKLSKRNSPSFVWDLNANGLATSCFYSTTDMGGQEILRRVARYTYGANNQLTRIDASANSAQGDTLLTENLILSGRSRYNIPLPIRKVFKLQGYWYIATTMFPNHIFNGLSVPYLGQLTDDNGIVLSATASSRYPSYSGYQLLGAPEGNANGCLTKIKMQISPYNPADSIMGEYIY